MATYYRVNLKDKKNNVVYPNIHNNIIIENESGEIHVQGKISNQGVMYYAKRIDTKTEIGFGVGDGGVNHGIWSVTLNKWIAYADASKIYLNGNAETASKWQTARTLNLTGFHNSSVTIDGSSDVTLTDYGYYNYVSVGNTNNYPYHRIASTGTLNSNYQDYNVILLIVRPWASSGGHGILKISVRTNNGNNGETSSVSARWLIREGIEPECIQFGFRNVAKATYLDVFYKSNGQWAGAAVKTLWSSYRGNPARLFTLYKSTEPDNTTTSDRKGAVESYSSFSDAASKLHGGTAYTSTFSATDYGHVFRATEAVQAGKVVSSLTTGSHIAGNTGTAIINSTAAANTYTMLAKQKSTNGVFTLGVWGSSYNLFYTGNTKINNNENSYNKRLVLLNENGESYFPGDVHCEKSSGDTRYFAKRTDVGVEVWMGVGSGGVNHGVYSNKLGKWIVYADGSSVHLNGKADSATNADNATKWNGQVYDGGTVNHTDTWIPVFNNGKLQHTLRVIANSKRHTNYNTDQGRLATLAFLSFWNGAFNSNNNSNLTYAHQGTIQCKPTNLYNNTSGIAGSLTLSQTAANFTYLKIYFYTDDKEYNETTVFSPNGKVAELSVISLRGKSKLFNVKGRNVYINGTSIGVWYDSAGTPRWGEFIWYQGGSQEVKELNKIYITRVDGYK